MGFLRLYVELPHEIVIGAIEISYLRNPWPRILGQRMICHSVDPDQNNLVCLSAGDVQRIRY